MTKRWAERVTWNPDIEAEAFEALDMKHSIIARILWGRGIRTRDELNPFIELDISEEHSPFLMKDMDEAVRRVLKAFRNKEKILVFGDYDVDGTTATAMLFSFLDSNGFAADFYIPDRYKEGYGVSTKGIDHARENEFGLIISVDCGIRSVELVDYAKELGIEFIICDHHIPGPVLPDAVAVLDPKREDDEYPFDELSGCGVAFKLIQALVSEMKLPPSEYERFYDLVAVSIASDLVPILGENRHILRKGLHKLAVNPIPGFLPIISGIEHKGSVSVENIVFMLGPRINAAGRISSGMEAVRMMLSQDEKEVRKLAAQVEKYNQERRELDKETFDEAMGQLEGGESDRYSTVVQSDNWHKGVIGIVASRLIEQYYRPTVVFTQSGDVLAGSARSIPGFDIHAALDQCQEYLIQFGGHYFAAGMTLLPDKLDAFKARFEEVAREVLSPEQLIEKLLYDAEVELHELSDPLFRSIVRIGPFGPGNPKPLFVTKNLVDSGKSRVVGKDRTHLKLELASPDDGIVMEGIGFSLADKYDLLRNGPVDVIYHLSENHFNGKVTLQLEVKDIQASS